MGTFSSCPKREQRMGREMTKKQIFYCFPVAKKHAKEIRDCRRVGCLRLGSRPRMRKGQEKSLPLCVPREKVAPNY